jgi:hypothetical protein
MDEDPVFAGGFARSELRAFKAWLLRGRDYAATGSRPSSSALRQERLSSAA